MAAAQRARSNSTPAGAPEQDPEGRVLDEHSVLEHLESRPPIDPLQPSLGLANGVAIGFAIWLVIALIALAVL
jgi:hypothetical protein